MMNTAAPKNQNCDLLIAYSARKRGIKNLNSIESKWFMTEKIFLADIKPVSLQIMLAESANGAA